jgi:hypothetical protein
LIRVTKAAIAREDSEEPRVASSVARRLWEKPEIDDRVAEERWKPAEAKKEAEVMVECSVASCSNEVN